MCIVSNTTITHIFLPLQLINTLVNWYILNSIDTYGVPIVYCLWQDNHNYHPVYPTFTINILVNWYIFNKIAIIIFLLCIISDMPYYTYPHWYLLTC